eukprot:10057238-Lingulodinium_polyedra.AAC.1
MTILDSDAQLGHAVNAAVRMLDPAAGEKQVRAQHGLAHPPTWAHHLGGPAGRADAQVTGVGG